MGSAFSCCGSEKVDQGEGLSTNTNGSRGGGWRIFTYKELHTATNGFSDDNKLGEGGFGSVYWGKTADGLQIAVKKLKSLNSKAEMEFAVEVEVLGRVRHKNLLGLRGYCVGSEQRLIVYDYMPNLSLLSHLHGQFANEVQLDWRKRMKIAIGSAEGLLYLHHEVTPHIIHRDIKASNVLLDSNFEPLVADFGFAKLIPEGVSHMTTRVKGTLGYLAPEYAMWGKVSESCDVYSFGILLLELITGRKPIEKLPGGVKRTITEWAEPLIAKNKFRDLVDPKLRGNFDEHQLKQAINVAALCVQGEPDKRPNMKEVVSLLKGSDPKVSTMQLRLQSVKYGDDLLALDQTSDDEKDRNHEDQSSAYGVFDAIGMQKMNDPYRHYANKKQPKILVGIPFDAEESSELLNWVITVLARPNDIVVAMHVLVAEEAKKSGKKEDDKKWQSIVKYQKQIRQAKAFVISITSEFVKTCQSKQVSLEARVGFGSSIGRGLTKEAKSIPADILVIGGKKDQSCNISRRIRRHCCEHAPEGCSLVLVGKHLRQKSAVCPNSKQVQEFCKSRSRWSQSSCDLSNSVSSDDGIAGSKSENEKRSPRTVLEAFETESQGTGEDSSSIDETSVTKSPIVVSEMKRQPEPKKPMSPLKIFSSFFRSPFDSSARKRNDALFKKEKQQPMLKCFGYEEIVNATNNFHDENMVGQGGFSEVYKGVLKDGSIIAVKRLAKDTTTNKENDFLMELGIIGHVNHPNTASLVGCCVENGLYLIFKFYPNGTLASALHGKESQPLEWPIRYRIALGVARGLHYLHKCCKHRIIHRDIKASNVLLGPDYEPQIADFGLAKWLPNKWTHHAVVSIEGTFGYLAPEYVLHGLVDEKTDVFAFGILLLEIITGRRPVDSSQQNLLLWAKPLMESGKLSELADPNLESNYSIVELHRLVLTASYCVRQSPSGRPSMTEVLELLTYGNDSEAARSWRIPKFTSDEIDDYSMVFGYQLPADLALED
ncbi:OLC1v1035260C1 [Oldenlandia corymbosa var. corymbosa]|uniref:OLC1v1035260C1 n=1 Tax=Oldenlandia corymbosa var. corymbosa TaxID=529605 RepID=A0AAV1CTE4_OLDCO|nr:OLC1v1035260C1 [Oldenlandia corymbosa var. corymbosa]